MIWQKARLKIEILIRLLVPFKIGPLFANWNAHSKGENCVIWKARDFNVDVISSIFKAIHYSVQHKFSNKQFSLTVVYVSNDDVERQVLQKFLIDLAGRIIEPWLITGDFNHVLFLDDRIAGFFVTHQDIEELQQCVFQAATEIEGLSTSLDQQTRF